jgi:NAD(P)-dependent dehydrogenase (short-subunit alcohol dehydrogenase family)
MNKTILVTGAAGNLGKATIEKFLAGGHTVIAVVSPGKGLDVQKNLFAYPADLSNESATQASLDKITSQHQAIHAAVLAVGGFAMGTIESTSSAEIQKMVSLNFNTSYHVARSVLKKMISQQEGRIILVGSRPALEPARGKTSVAYSLSKSLIFQLAELINTEASAKNVKASVIVPDIIDTPANRQDMPKADFSKWVTPQAIAHIIYDLVMGKRTETVIQLY